MRQKNDKRKIKKFNDNDTSLSYPINPILLALDTPISIVDLHQVSFIFPP